MKTVMLKEEYSNEDTIYKIVKKEEDFIPKVEEDSSSAGYQSQESLQTPMTLPWNTHFLQFYSTPLNAAFHPMNSLYFCRRWPEKPFIIIKQENVTNAEPPQSDNMAFSVKKEAQIEIIPGRKKMKAVRVSACKNYIGLLCAGFSRAILTAERDSDTFRFMRQLLSTKRIRYEGTIGNLSDEELIDVMKQHIYSNICGKKVKKVNKDRDFKIRNTEELENLLVIKTKDSEWECFKKEMLKEMVNYFFNSELYDEWIYNGMISEPNRFFFIKNKKEIHNKFQNPNNYKPRFNYHSYEIF